MYLGAPLTVIGNGGARSQIFYPRVLPSPVGPVWPGPPAVWTDPGSVRPISRPIDTGGPASVAVSGTPVPAGFPTNQIFVNSDGSFWEFSPSQNTWVNVGTPYGTGASATPPAPPPSSTGSRPPSTTAPAPVPASATPIVTSSYQEILDWLNQDSLLATIGFAGIPNWITSAGVSFLLYRVSAKQGRR